MSKRTDWKTEYAEVLEKAERALETGLTVQDKDGGKGTLVKIDRENIAFTFLIRYSPHHLAWIGVDGLVIPDGVEERGA